MADVERKKGKHALFTAYLESLKLLRDQHRVVLGVQIQGMLLSAVARALETNENENFKEGVSSGEYSLMIDIRPDDSYDDDDVETKCFILERCIQALEEENEE